MKSPPGLLLVLCLLIISNAGTATAQATPPTEGMLHLYIYLSISLSISLTSTCILHPKKQSGAKRLLQRKIFWNSLSNYLVAASFCFY
jgi:hypothetical protein